MPKVGVCIFAIGEKYWDMFPPLYESMKKFLKIPFRVYLFTDEVKELERGEEITKIPMPFSEWPMPTMMRYHSVLGWKDELEGDYLLLHDVDMEYVKDVSYEILGPIVAVIRSMYDLRWGLRFPFEPNPKSEAYIQPQRYYYGGFVGGEREKFLELAKRVSEGIDKDFKNGYIAIWHEESHLNKYLNENPPSMVLDPSYCYPETMREYYRVIWGRDYEPKIIEKYKRWKFSEKEDEEVKKVMTDYIPVMKGHLDST